MFKPVVNPENILGECPIWCERTLRLLWTNISGKELFAYTPESSSLQRWALPDRLGSFALTQADNVLLVGLASRLAYFDLASGTVTDITAFAGAAGTRIGDGRCDREGNFVFGTMHEGDPPQAVGAFYRLNAVSMTVEQLPLPCAAITNGICFSPDGSTMYYCDSLQQTIFCCDYPSFKNNRIFTKIVGGGAPDGSCVDAEGFLWNAEWGGGRAVRYTPGGSIDLVVRSPASQMTCPVIGGPQYDTLYCTSARAGMQVPGESDGALFSVPLPRIRGLPESRFSGLAKATVLSAH